MRQSPFDWISRVVMLVLAGMVSLSIIGSIAAIPSGSIEGTIGIDRPQPPPAEPQEQNAVEAQLPGPPQPEPGEAQGNAVTGAGGVTGLAAPAPPEEPKPEDWLETIAYALLALVGLAALGTLFLWRGAREHRRLAEALEALATRERP